MPLHDDYSPPDPPASNRRRAFMPDVTQGVPDADHTLVMAFRQALLIMVDALEVRFGISPRTSELRREHRKK